MIRDATPADAEALARVHVATWQAAYAHVFPAEELAAIDIEARVEHWRGILTTSEGTTLVAERDGEVIGFSGVGPGRDGAGGELYAIYVRPDYWDSGAGRELMEAAEAHLRAQGSEEAFLWVLDDNPRARRFYERAGWSTDGGVKEDDFLGVRVREIRYRKRLL